MPATAKKILSSIGGPKPRVEVSIPAADDLYREIRIENQLIGLDGKPIALTAGARLTLTLEAEISGTAPDAN